MPAKAPVPPPAAPAAPAPLAPSPSPAPPAPAPGPAPGSAAATVPPAPAAGGDVNPFAEIDAKFAAADKPVPTTTGKPDVGKPPKAKPAPATAPAGTPPEGAAGGARAPAELRQELDRLKGELATKNQAHTDLQAKIAEFEARGKETTALAARLSDLEKQIADKDGEIRMLKHEVSPEFKKQYDEPFDEAAAFAQNFVESLTVLDGDETRQAKWDDFVKLWNMGNSQAITEAKAVFGDAAQIVLNHLFDLRKLDQKRSSALKSERANAASRAQEDEAKAVAQREQIDTAWKAVNKDLTEQVADYHDAPEDTEAAEARQKALAIYDAKPRTLRERIVRDAHVRQRAAAFGPLKLKILRLEKENADLKAQIAGEEVPGKTLRTGGAPPAGKDESWEDQARRELNQ